MGKKKDNKTVIINYKIDPINYLLKIDLIFCVIIFIREQKNVERTYSLLRLLIHLKNLIFFCSLLSNQVH